jgi:hypothetical protein
MSFIGALVLIFGGSSAGRGHFEWVLIPVFIACAALVIGFFAAITSAATLAAEATGSDALGIVTWCGLFLGALFLNRYLADRFDPIRN